MPLLQFVQHVLHLTMLREQLIDLLHGRAAAAADVEDRQGSARGVGQQGEQPPPHRPPAAEPPVGARDVVQRHPHHRRVGVGMVEEFIATTPVEKPSLDEQLEEIVN